MQNNILDTNILVSALIQRSFPFYIVYGLFLERKINIFISEELLEEYGEVLHRPKFAHYRDFYIRAESLLYVIATRAKIITPKNTINLISDKPDNVLLELADECCADFIITGNTKHFTFQQYKNTRIVTPREYCEQFSEVF